MMIPLLYRHSVLKVAEAIEDIDYDDTDKWNIEHPDDPKKFGRIEKYIDPKTGEVKSKIKSYTLREAISRIYDMSKFLEKANKDLIDVAQTQKLKEGELYKTNLEILQDLELIIAKQLGKDITPEYNFEQELDFRYVIRLQDSKRVMKNKAIDTIHEIREDVEKDVYGRMKMNKEFLLGENSKGYRKAYSEEVEKIKVKR